MLSAIRQLSPIVLKEWLEIATYGIAILAALGSLWQYRRNSARERTRWLFELYQRFYEQKTLRAMRVRIDCGDTRFVDGDDLNLLGDLDDFLNFFELIAYLWRRRELNTEEVRVMFDYPLQTIAANQAVFGYATKYGYDELGGLLKELSDVRSTRSSAR